jgi:hypothetical protein
VVLETGAATEPPSRSPASLFVPAAVTRYQAEQVEVKVQAPLPGWLVLLDRDAPGWSCTVDDVPAPILRANYLFRAVRVPAGPHRLAFRYRAPRLLAGALVSLLGLVVAAAFAAGCLRARGGTGPYRRSR